MSDKEPEIQWNPETGEFEGFGDLASDNQISDELLLNNDDSKQPAMKFNRNLGTLEYVDEKIKELRDKRDSLRNVRDPLEGKEELLKQGLEEIGLQTSDMGKTGDSSSGEISDKHHKVAESQIEDAKHFMLQARKQR